MDFPSDNVAAPPFLTTYSRWSAFRELQVATGGALGQATQTWTVANTASYYPITIPFSYTVRRVFWVNGGTVTNGNLDFGIYTKDGVRLYSTGSTAIGTASVPQFTTPASPIRLSPGDYYFAYTCSTSSAGRVMGNSSAAILQRMSGIMQQTSALPLPATATFASASGVTITNLCGVTWTSTGY